MFKNNRVTSFIIISFISILISRIIPHPPNFTTSIALAFYLPALFGYKYMIIALTAFILSDLVIGLHSLLVFTWSSIILIGFFSKYFKNFYLRILGVAGGCMIFYLVSNFGVWFLSGTYTNNMDGLLTCYIMGLPFLQNSLLSSLAVAIFIESLISMKFTKTYISKINTNFLY